MQLRLLMICRLRTTPERKTISCQAQLRPTVEMLVLTILMISMSLLLGPVRSQHLEQVTMMVLGILVTSKKGTKREKRLKLDNLEMDLSLKIQRNEIG